MTQHSEDSPSKSPTTPDPDSKPSSPSLQSVTTREILEELHSRMFQAEHNVHIVWYLEGSCAEALEHLPLNLLEYPNEIDHENYQTQTVEVRNEGS
jgi:hypothetical protein